MQTLTMQTPKALGYVGRQPGMPPRDGDAWFTPPPCLDRVRRCLGHIDLDPFSSAAANKTVKATRYFSLTDSAYGRPWSNGKPVTVFMNPPYGRSTLPAAVQAFAAAWDDGQIAQAIVLTNNCTETAWFRQLALRSAAMCLVTGRLAFTNVDGKATSGNTRGQILFYVGSHIVRFKAAFADMGVLVRCG